MDIDSKDGKKTRPRMDIDTYFPSKLSKNFIQVDLPSTIHHPLQIHKIIFRLISQPRKTIFEKMNF